MRPRSNTGPILAIGLVLLLLAGVGVAGAVVVANRDDRRGDAGYYADRQRPTRPSAAPRSTERPESTEAPESSGTSETTEARPSSGRTTRTTTRPRTTTRTTEAGPRSVTALATNPLFSTTNGVPVTACSLPAWRSDPQSAAAFFTAALPCFERAWAPVMARANLPYTTPSLQFPGGASWDSPCGMAQSTWAAFYCPQNQTIYMPYEGLAVDQIGNKPGAYLSLFSHEFAHHVQELSGVNGAYWAARYEAGDQTALGLELSRRSELQAQCLGGMWFAGGRAGGGSITEQVIREMLADGYIRGDWRQGAPRDHGTPQHYGAWQQHGYQNNRTAPCNTWAAATADVA